LNEEYTALINEKKENSMEEGDQDGDTEIDEDIEEIC